MEKEKFVNMGTDMEIAVFLVKHIENPCVEPSTGQNIRDFYMREAKKVLETIENPEAKSMLEDAIRKYQAE